jgi:hypothetical protein
MVAPQTVVSMRCTTNQRNIVCQSNDALKAIYGAGTDLIMLENKRKSGNADLTRLEKSDSSRDFFSCLDFVGDRGDFFDFFRIMCFFAKDLLRKWGANTPFRAEFDGESIGSICRARRDLQQRRIARSVSK